MAGALRDLRGEGATPEGPESAPSGAQEWAPGAFSLDRSLPSPPLGVSSIGGSRHAFHSYRAPGEVNRAEMVLEARTAC